MTARLCFIDTETTSLRHDRRAWEIGIIARDPDGTQTEHHWFVDADCLELGNADVMSLKIGRFYERHPQMQRDRDSDWTDVQEEPDTLWAIESITRGAHLVGAVVSFDADVISQRMRKRGICPSWHYHLIDVEALAVGWLARDVGRDEAARIPPGCAYAPPWKSDDLSAALGIRVSDEDRHTALGDARWAMAIYDHIMGSPS